MQHKSKKVLGLVITDGVGYRNFFLSDFPARAVQQFEKVVIFSGLPASQYAIGETQNLEVVELPVFVEPFKTWLWRKFKELAHLQLHKAFFGIKDNLAHNRAEGRTNRARASRILYRITGRFHSENFIQKLELLQQESLEDHSVTKWCSSSLKEKSPDILFFTHQRPPYVMPLLVAAKTLGVNTGSFIFSWDNLSSKGRMAADFENYLVWSDLMKRELLQFYPSTVENKVVVAGTPQFEPYVMPKYRSERETFYAKFDLKPDLKTICYSCGDISTSRNDELYIQKIAAFIEQEELIVPVNFLVRTSPAEDPDRFFQLKDKYPFIKWNFPAWPISRLDHPEPWSQRVPTSKDITDLRSILEFSDLSINMCSTMSLDFMIFDKPVVNPVFGNEENGLYNDQRFLKFGHYEKVVESGAVRVAKNEEQLLEAINFYLRNSGEDRTNRKMLLDLQIGRPLENTSNRIALALTEIA